MPTRKPATHNKLTNWLLRSLLVVGQRSRLTNSGFVLPTVVMVSLVIVLLTAALIARSLDRTKNASNARVNQAALNAAAPALDRARAKLDALFEDPNLPRATPADRRLRDVMDDSKYTFPDEVRLKLVADANNNNTIGENSNRTAANYTLENDETSRQGWKFPVDTDSNGRYDAYTFYSIAWRLPPRDANGTFTRGRSPLEARTPPMSVNNVGGQCATAAGTSASLVGNSGWYASNGKIVKSFSVYAATVPIASGDPVLSDNRYEANNKNKGISVLEVQQDRSRVPLNNNAVLYEDDLDITPGPEFKLNGRVFTNSNLFTTGNNVTLFQVSSQNSCYYTEDNSRIEVGGNIGKGSLIGNTVSGDNVGIHLFNGAGVEPRADVFRSTDQSTTNNPREVAYNSRAYTLRIDFLVRAAQLRAATTDPQEVIDDTARRLREDPGLGVEARRRSLERYFRNRTRRIPYAEVPFGQEATLAVGTYTTATVFAGRDNPLRPPDEWALPANLTTGASFNNLTLATAKPEATDSETNRTDRKEARLGDRILIGNGLPATWFNGLKFVGEGVEQLVRTAGGTPEKWTARNTIDRTRSTRVDELSDLGDTGRNGFWEQSAAQKPEDKLQAVGGLRVVTGAGIYAPTATTTFLPSPPDSDPVNPVGDPTLATYDDPNTLTKETYRVVWPDSMPMSRSDDPNTTSIDESTLSGHLKMRATAVYHYDVDSYDPNNPTAYQDPVACVSSYYDPTNAVTARNRTDLGLPDVSGGVDTTVVADGTIDRLYNGDAPGAPLTTLQGARSNNGVSYSPGTTASSIGAAPGSLDNSTGLFSPEDSNVTAAGNLRAKLNYQANLVFPNGRFVNEPLRNALKNLDAGRSLSLADQSAIDSSLCGLNIASNSLAPSEARIPHGAIKEAAFLDARQVKAVEGRSFAITTGSSAGNVRTYTVSDLSDVGDTGTLTPRIRVGDVVTIQGFTGSGNETLLNVVKGTVTAVTPDASTPPNSGGTIQVTTLVPATVSATSLGKAGITELLTTRSDRAIEDRQPLEVRTTVIDLNRIRSRPIAGGIVSAALGMQGEYVLPNSGIIYATRDDATPDLSEPLPTTAGLADEQRQATQRLLSPVDYRLDPSRRPNGIMLVNGSRLNRTDDNTYRAEEKGLILATNLPVYVQADTLRGTTAALRGFNLHNSEEFTQTLATIANWDFDDFYDARTTLDPQFACRPGTPGLNCSPGDFWRPASVISDAVSLLSDKFALGYRVDGDYDLRNNAQDNWATVKKRRQNGFFDNNFVTSRAFTDADYRGNPDTPPANYRPSSYFNNFITPIQRRVNTHEYLMEMCIKVPVSSCGPTDWWVRPPKTNSNADLGLKATAAVGNTFNVGTTLADTVHTAGTTTQPALPGFQQYARRVAFARNVYGALEFTPMISGTKNEATAIPLGITGPGAIARFPYTGAPPRKQNNTLWYAAVKNVNTAADAGYGKPGYAPNRTYATDQPLYYLPPEKGGEKLILPDTPEIPGVPSLNGPGNTDPSDYTACIKNSGVSQSYQVNGFPVGATCDNATLEARIQAARDALGNTTLIPSVGTLTKGTQTLTASQVVNAYDMASGNPSFDPGAKITLVGNSDSIFILRNRSSVEFGRNGQPGVTLDLQGVSPNNVFWVSDGAITFADATAAAPHQLAGNFFGKTDMKVGAYTTIFGGRFLGFSNNSQAIPATSSLTAVTADGQPLVAPVLQTQVTTGSPTDTNDLSAIPNNNIVSNNTRWQQRATTNNFNLVIAAGDSPARVANTADTANSWIEGGGGLHNFPRFLEDWTGVKARIAGSFIQIKRSAYATAPFQPVVVATDASFVQSTNPQTATGVSLFGSDYRQAYRTNNGEIGSSTNWGKHPYYEPPDREWGFDVALLTQLPDLFAQRFTAPSGTRDEFFRQVDRSDAWVQTLLCAAQPANLSNAQARQSGVAPSNTTFVPALQTNNPYRPACTATDADYNRP